VGTGRHDKIHDVEGGIAKELDSPVHSVVGGLSFHKTIPELVNNPTALSVFGRILAANGGLIMGHD
jgi:hypothetical protein